MRGFGAILILLCLGGCTVRLVQDFTLTARLVNESNKLLSIEGESNLPEGAPIEARLLDKKGRRLARGQGQIREGAYFIVLDVARVPGFSRHSLQVFYDPIIAPGEVTDVTGPRGEAMRGGQVQFEAGRYLLLENVNVVLEVNNRMAGYRQLESGDLAAAVRELESHLQRNPRDVDATLRLAQTYLEWRQAENRTGTRAHLLLQRVIDLAPESEQARQAHLRLARIDAERRAAKARLALRQSMANGGRFRTEKRVVPGKALGAIKLGMPYRVLARRFPTLSPPQLKGTGVEEVVLRDFNGVSVGVDRLTRRIVWARAEGVDFYELDQGLKMGSPLQAFRGKYPIRRPNYGAVSVDQEGFEVSYGTVLLEGLSLTFQRRTDPMLKLPVDRLYAVEVFAPEDR